MTDTDPFVVGDLATFYELVNQGRVSVGWTVYPDVGPEWIGSCRKLDFFVDSRPLLQNQFALQLAELLMAGLQIPDSSPDHVISGEGWVRQNGNAIEVEYEWSKAIPYHPDIETGSGVITLLKLDVL